jgi:hypothetical protein
MGIVFTDEHDVVFVSRYRFYWDILADLLIRVYFVLCVDCQHVPNIGPQQQDVLRHGILLIFDFEGVRKVFRAGFDVYKVIVVGRTHSLVVGGTAFAVNVGEDGRFCECDYIGDGDNFAEAIGGEIDGEVGFVSEEGEVVVIDDNGAVGKVEGVPIRRFPAVLIDDGLVAIGIGNFEVRD